LGTHRSASRSDRSPPRRSASTPERSHGCGFHQVFAAGTRRRCAWAGRGGGDERCPLSDHRAAQSAAGKRRRRALGLTRRFLGSLVARRCSLGGQPARQAHDSPLTRRVRVLGVSCNWGCGFSIATRATPQYAAPAVPLDWSSWGTAQKRWRAPRGQPGALSAFLCPSLCDRGRPVGCPAPTLRGPAGGGRVLPQGWFGAPAVVGCGLMVAGATGQGCCWIGGCGVG
jgi:hypothetical protein